MDKLVFYLNMVPPEVWETIIAALFLSPFMVKVKKWFKVNRSWVMMLNVMGGALLLAGGAYLANTPNHAPWIIAAQGLITYALSQPVYYGIVKPVRKHWAAALDEASHLNDSKKAAAVPPSGLPLAPRGNDFGK